MLLLSFDICGDQYVINTNNVIEVTTLVRLKKLPGTINGIAGLLNYHGTAVPVVDISELCGKPLQSNTLTTRIIIVDYLDNNILGIKAENVTETLRVENDAFKKSGVHINNKEFLGEVAEVNNRFIQMINIDELLNDEARRCLFAKNQEVIGQ